MSWLAETNGTPVSVQQLLNQIQGHITICTQELNQVLLHRNRCFTCAPTDMTHKDTAFHGPSSVATRATAYAQLASVEARLRQIKIDLGLCSSEMSHGGNP
jgi:hypothetical protein